ncbi:UDP-xylose transporter 3 [Camellia lanceoleosa]|uniref:UDP-xylose transporter 3 n=1 Tax=Camellia lanceoleosa TaxID=1840588 RepID=A0ACC0J0L1_9ERIC|nr:UDP-xylose transporter 3 [Camellia lanceoleosa]
MTKLAIIPCTVLLETLFFSKKFRLILRLRSAMQLIHILLKFLSGDGGRAANSQWRKARAEEQLVTTTCSSFRRIQLSLSILLLGVGIATVTDLQLNIMGSILSLLAVVTTCVAQIVFIVLSCLISVSVNFSTFLVIGKTSPVTYQVLGHLKTCLVLAFGYVLLHDPFSWRNIFGIVIALVGMVLYSYYCTLESQQKATEVLPQTSQAKEGESDPLMSARKV